MPIAFAPTVGAGLLAGSNPPSATHPATKDRLVVVDAFLNGEKNIVVDLFNDTLKAKSLKTLTVS